MATGATYGAPFVTATTVLARMFAGLIGAISLSAASPASTTAASLTLARVFGDGVVLQRGARLPVWGTAQPNARVVVRMRAHNISATADSAGAWRAELPPMIAGGPFTMTVVSNGDSLVVRDVLVGDVWVASGQSNMEWKLADATDGARDAAAANDPMLREFKVPTSWSWNAEPELTGGSWRSATPANAGNFSAVAYHFAREVRKATGVPIGIVNSTWGGASIAPWISRTALSLDDLRWNAVRATEDRYQAGLREGLRARLGALPTIDSGLVNGRAVWAAPSYDDSAWRMLKTPGAWERSGYAGLDGIAWYRTTVTLTDADVRSTVGLALGTIDDADITYVNGTEVGRTHGYAVQRRYTIPATALHAGANTIAVRVTDGGGDGGVMGPPDGVYLDVGGARRPLPAEWRFKVATVQIGEDGQHTNKISSALYNRMIHPLLDFPIAGVIWYQGESNSNNDEQARAYAQDFRTLIQSWRAEWKSPRAQFPFLWVQLPAYGTPDASPPPTGGWALLRESQSAALALPNTGQAVTLDLGEATNLHPRNKRDVGHRLALLARKVAYGQAVVADGPAYRDHAVLGDHIDVHFSGSGTARSAGLVAKEATDGKVEGFAIAGTDGKFVWANARVVGDTVRVSSPEVASPVSVRYAWGNSPARATLVNRSGLPAAPFRTDAPRDRWVSTWHTSQQLVEERNLPPQPGLTGSTLRQRIHVSVGGARARLRFANLFGNGPVQLHAVQVALTDSASAIKASTARTLTFRGAPSVTIPAGETVASDALDFAFGPLADVTVSMYITAAPSDVNGHPGSRTTSYLQTGNHVADPSMPDAVKTEHWYLIAGLDVVASDSVKAVSIVGNSITDGRGSGTDKNNRWPDELSRRLQANAATRNVAVLNAGIGGNAVLRGGLGPPAVWRAARDLFEQHGIGWGIVFEGVNDIGGARGPDASAAVARDLIEAYKVFIANARTRGIPIYGATILPFGGSQYDSPDHEKARQTVNAWIRSTAARGGYDAVIDFDAALRDPANPTRLLPFADSGDHLHPSEAGHHAMAEAVSLALFRTKPAPSSRPSPRSSRQ